MIILVGSCNKEGKDSLEILQCQLREMAKTSYGKP
jgi:hypothetical protein